MLEKFSQYIPKKILEKLTRVYIHNHGFDEVYNNTGRILETVFESELRVKWWQTKCMTILLYSELNIVLPTTEQNTEE